MLFFILHQGFGLLPRDARLWKLPPPRTLHGWWWPPATTNTQSRVTMKMKFKKWSNCKWEQLHNMMFNNISQCFLCVPGQCHCRFRGYIPGLVCCGYGQDKRPVPLPPTAAFLPLRPEWAEKIDAGREGCVTPLYSLFLHHSHLKSQVKCHNKSLGGWHGPLWLWPHFIKLGLYFKQWQSCLNLFFKGH